MPKYNLNRAVTSFETTASGIPCLCVVTEFTRYLPARYSGNLMGPAEPACAEWLLLDRRGYRAEWLEKKLSRDEIERLDHDAVLMCVQEDCFL